MGRNIDERIRKIQKVGNTYTVSLPICDMREAKWRENQKVVVEFDKRGKKFIIKDWK